MCNKTNTNRSLQGLTGWIRISSITIVDHRGTYEIYKQVACVGSRNVSQYIPSTICSGRCDDMMNFLIDSLIFAVLFVSFFLQPHLMWTLLGTWYKPFKYDPALAKDTPRYWNASVDKTSRFKVSRWYMSLPYNKRFGSVRKAEKRFLWLNPTPPMYKADSFSVKKNARGSETHVISTGISIRLSYSAAKRRFRGQTFS